MNTHSITNHLIKNQKTYLISVLFALVLISAAIISITYKRAKNNTSLSHDHDKVKGKYKDNDKVIRKTQDAPYEKDCSVLTEETQDRIATDIEKINIAISQPVSSCGINHMPPEMMAKISKYLSKDEIAFLSIALSEQLSIDQVRFFHFLYQKNKISFKDLQEILDDFRECKEKATKKFSSHHDLIIKIHGSDENHDIPQDIADILKKNSNLYKSLSIAISGHESIKALVNTNLKVGFVLSVALDEIGYRCLKQTLADLENLHITRLDFHTGEINAESMKTLAQAIQSSKLKYFGISCTNIYRNCMEEESLEGVNALANIIKQGKLVSLRCGVYDMERPIHNIAIGSVKDAILSSNCNLQHFHFQYGISQNNNNYLHRSMPDFVLQNCASILQQKNTLKSLGLDSSLEAQDEYILALANALTHPNCQLESLHLSFFSISNKAIYIICGSLRSIKCKVNQFTAGRAVMGGTIFYTQTFCNTELQRLGQAAIKERQEELRSASTTLKEASISEMQTSKHM